MEKKKRIKLSFILILVGALMFSMLFILSENIWNKIPDMIAFVYIICSVTIIIGGIIIYLAKPFHEYMAEEQSRVEESNVLEKYNKKQPIITYILIGINVIMFVAINMMNGNEKILEYAISKESFSILKIFTSMFGHASETHIALNMLCLLMCGSKLENYIGKTKYSITYMLSGIIAALLVGIFSNSPCIGASGAIFGIFGCLLLLSFSNRNIMKYTFKYDLLPTVIMNLIVTFIVPGISAIAHVTGLITGMLCFLLLCRKIKL